MQRFKRILAAMVPGRLDRAGLHRAADLAAANGAQLTVFDVVEPVARWGRMLDIEGKSVDLQSLLNEDHLAALESLVDRAAPGAARAVVAGKPSVEVIREVLRNEHDLVIVGEAPPQDHGHGFSLGTLQLLRKCPVPVWVMRPSRARKVRILALVDPDPDDPVREELNDQIVDLAASMHRRHNGELHIAHAWMMPGEHSLRSSIYLHMPDHEVDLLVASAREMHEDRITDLIDRHDVSDEATVHLVKGPPDRVLPELAKRLKSNVIVMGTVARTGLSGHIMGNTAEAILGSVDCSVLAVKPKGFETPVKPNRSVRVNA